MNYFLSSAIDDREHRKRKDCNKSPGLEVTVRLIEHSWFRCKFGASRSAGSHDLHLSRGFIVHDIWIVRVVSREIAARRDNVDKAKLSAEWERAARSFIGKKKRPITRFMTANLCFSIFYGPLILPYNCQACTTYCQFCKQWRSFQLLDVTRTLDIPRLWWNIFFLSFIYIINYFISIA